MVRLLAINPNKQISGPPSYSSKKFRDPPFSPPPPSNLNSDLSLSCVQGCVIIIIIIIIIIITFYSPHFCIPVKLRNTSDDIIIIDQSLKTPMCVSSLQKRLWVIHVLAYTGIPRGINIQVCSLGGNFDCIKPL